MNPSNLWPYEHRGYMPLVRPEILGAPVETTYYRIREEIRNQQDQITDGRRIRFLKNGVITGLMSRISQTKGWSFESGVGVVKNGHDHLFTDGKTPQFIHPHCISPRGSQDGANGWMKVWIPVDAGDVWTVNFKQKLWNAPPFVLGTMFYSFVARVEQFLEVPEVIPEYLPTSLIYSVQEVLPPVSKGKGREFDFRHDGIVTGLRAITPYGTEPWQGLSGVELDIVREGTNHLSMSDNATSPIDCTELAGDSEDYQQIWKRVNSHEKWQVFATNRTTFQQSYRLTARVEEQRKPWSNW